MKTTIIGFPRVGSLRELKFASEKYFRGEISAEELQNTAKELRCTHWQLQKENGISLIPVNDFSFYDNMLDTAVLLNAVPERYRALSLSPLDTYFAMARGYQGEHGDVKAFAMKKWFNTNYHYMVPEIEDTTEIRLAGEKPFAEYAEAKALGVPAKLVLIGPFTFLKLARFTGEKTLSDFVEDTVKAYCDYLAKLNELGAAWAELDEPYLVKDLSAEDIALFTQIYKTVLAAKGNVKVLLQTYFGDVRDCYSEITALDFDGIGLDFTEGKQTMALVQKNGFPKEKILFAGVVNGKNIWRNSYKKTLKILEQMRPVCGEIVLNTSCSLLHVPYTLRNETKLAKSYQKHFAFAEEKLEELAELVNGHSGDATVKGVAGSTWRNDTKGITPVNLSDGPAGLRIAPECGVCTTAWPCATLLAYTWNPNLVEQVGAVGAEEVKEKLEIVPVETVEQVMKLVFA